MISRRREAGSSAAVLQKSLRTAVLGISTLAVSATLLVGISSTPAAADPPLTVAEAKAQVDELEMDASAIDQDAVAVRDKLTAGKRKLALKQEDVRQQTARVARIRKQVGQVALAQFQNRSLDTAAQLLLNSDSDGFLDQVSTVEKVSENQNTALQDYQSSQARLAELERSARVDVASLQSQDAELARLRVSSAAKVTQSKAVLARLTKEERERIAAEEKAAEIAAQLAADKAAAAKAKQQSGSSSSEESSSSGSRESSSSSSSSEGSSSSSNKGAVALAFAKRQIGKPYVYAADGPDSYDCSGLTSAAWRAAGISIPRVSRDQASGAGEAVSKSDLRPGDLVFFYSPISHVGLYAGDGMILHAPRPGKSVQYIKMSYMPYAGARRPG